MCKKLTVPAALEEARRGDPLVGARLIGFKAVFGKMQVCKFLLSS